MNRTLAIVGLACQVVFLIAWGFTIVSIVGALAVAQQSLAGDIDGVTRELSRGSTAMLVGLPIGGVGTILFLTAARKEKSRWMRRVGTSASILYLPLFPFGTVLGILTLIVSRSIGTVSTTSAQVASGVRTSEDTTVCTDRR